jgi:fibronectin type 3 domain-containing protein
VRYIGSTLVCRGGSVEVTSCGTPVAKVAANAIPAPPPKNAPAKKPTHAELQTYADTLPAPLERDDPNAEITYAIEVLNRNARSAGLSNRVHVSAVVTLPPPTDLSAKLTGDGVNLTWSRVVALHNPEIHFSYRIYRRDEATGKDAVVGEVPFVETGLVRFTDTGFEWEKTYAYRVTVVSLVKRADGEIQIEGDDSPPVRVIAHDVFPPAIPEGLQAVFSGEGQKPFIDLIWAPVTNGDLAGYNVYRSEGTGKTIKLNSDPVKSTSYRDGAVVSGATYTYSVSAVDARANESARSEVASESVP